MSKEKKSIETSDGTFVSEAEILATNHRRFGRAPEQIDMIAVENYVTGLSEQELTLYMTLRPRANSIGLRLSQEVSAPWRMVLIDNMGHELSLKTSSLNEIDARLQALIGNADLEANSRPSRE